MSAPTLTLWPKLIHKLEEKAGLHGNASRLSLDARAQHARTIIENGYGRAGFISCLKDALQTGSKDVPENTSKLAQIRWPLVVSTNYDDLFFYACRCRRLSQYDEEWANEMSVQVLGRSPRDCKLVVSSLTGPFDRQYIWHVQGFLGGQYPGGNPDQDVPNRMALQDQLVIGHAEYRRITNRAPEFRRCFTEVFNSRSFLFLGSSLKEDYFLNLFGEVLDLCGPSEMPHFAFAESGQVDAHFLADQMNITVCEFPRGKFEELPQWLDCLKTEIQKPKARSTCWAFSMGPFPEVEADLEIVHGYAPVGHKNEAVAFVAYREKGVPVPPKPFKKLANERHFKVRDHVIHYPGFSAYAVTARCRKDDSDSAVSQAVDELLTAISNKRDIKTVHFQFSATGGTVPPIYAFIEVIRGIGEWRARHRNREHCPRLVLYIQSDVELCLTSGRIDVPELLASRLIRFWVLIISSEGQEPVRRAVHYRPDTPVKKVLKEVSVPANSRWSVSVCPSPRIENSKRHTRQVQNLSIVELGVAFGSVLTLEYSAKSKKQHTREPRSGKQEVVA